MVVCYSSHRKWMQYWISSSLTNGSIAVVQDSWHLAGASPSPGPTATHPWGHLGPGAQRRIREDPLSLSTLQHRLGGKGKKWCQTRSQRVQTPGGDRKLSHLKNWNDSAWPDFEGETVEAPWCGGSEGGLRGCLGVRPCLAVSRVCDLGK